MLAVLDTAAHGWELGERKNRSSALNQLELIACRAIRIFPVSTDVQQTKSPGNKARVVSWFSLSILVNVCANSYSTRKKKKADKSESKMRR